MPKAGEVFHRFVSLAGVGITQVARVYALKINFRESPMAPADMLRTLDGVPVVCEVVEKVTKRRRP